MHSEDICAVLNELVGLAHQTEVDERTILEKAESRLELVNAQLAAWQPISSKDCATQENHTLLVQEQATLLVVIGKARAILGV